MGCTLENYFAGHIMQEIDTPFLGTIILKTGSVVVGEEHVKIEGEAILEELMDDEDALSPLTVTAFTKCEIIRLDWSSMRQVLQNYHSDLDVIEDNLERAKDKSKFMTNRSDDSDSET